MLDTAGFIFQVLNLFLVLLLSSFSADALDNKDDDDEVDKITEAKGRIVRLVQYIKKGVTNKFCAWRNNRMGQKNNGLALSESNMEELKDVSAMSRMFYYGIGDFIYISGEERVME